jgi:hypothetical protein
MAGVYLKGAPGLAPGPGGGASVSGPLYSAVVLRHASSKISTVRSARSYSTSMRFSFSRRAVSAEVSASSMRCPCPASVRSASAASNRPYAAVSARRRVEG